MRPAPATGRAEPASALDGVPIFVALAARWRAEGRVVPGQTDREWVMLVSNCPWPVTQSQRGAVVAPRPVPAAPASSLGACPATEAAGPAGQVGPPSRSGSLTAVRRANPSCHQGRSANHSFPPTDGKLPGYQLPQT